MGWGRIRSRLGLPPTSLFLFSPHFPIPSKLCQMHTNCAWSIMTCFLVQQPRAAGASSLPQTSLTKENFKSPPPTPPNPPPNPPRNVFHAQIQYFFPLRLGSFPWGSFQGVAFPLLESVWTNGAVYKEGLFPHGIRFWQCSASHGKGFFFSFFCSTFSWSHGLGSSQGFSFKTANDVDSRLLSSPLSCSLSLVLVPRTLQTVGRKEFVLRSNSNR